MPASWRRIALRLQYDGAPFAGSQRQLGQPTVQAALEEAVAALTAERLRADFAGRTDAGVHATGQVAAITSNAALPPRRWRSGLNHYLPRSVAVQQAREVPLDFDPRGWACDRTYHYRIALADVRQPLREGWAWVQRGALDRRRMQAALDRLIGEHDFAAFAAAPSRPGTVRTMQEARVEETAEGFRFVFRAQSFLPHQIRRTVGQVVRIGRGDEAPDRIDRLLAEPRTGSAGPTAPPQGLILVRVRYALAQLADWNNDHEDVCRSQA